MPEFTISAIRRAWKRTDIEPYITDSILKTHCCTSSFFVKQKTLKENKCTTRKILEGTNKKGLINNQVD